MREILVRNLTSADWLKRDCVVSELMRQGDYATRVIRRCTYRVESQTELPSTHDSIPWARNLDPLPPRQVFVTKDMDPETGGERVVYKVLGHFYVVWGRSVFCVGYRHILAMDIDATEESASLE
ncbi:MAG: hypothetical protein HYT90_03490 [Candidatus Omnitrophica bacterium]|nr:hypothetical protein [Candidatus Omnitrophota bacterium]